VIAFLRMLASTRRISHVRKSRQVVELDLTTRHGSANQVKFVCQESTSSKLPAYRQSISSTRLYYCRTAEQAFRPEAGAKRLLGTSALPQLSGELVRRGCDLLYFGQREIKLFVYVRE